MKVEIVTIGDELLLGLTVDSNAAYLARELGSMGISVARHATVGDDRGAIVDVLREATARTGAVICTGGLGPTSDDITREALAELFGVQLSMDGAVAARLRAAWASRAPGDELPGGNLSQAMVPEGARLLENRRGTAPGLWLQDAHGRWVAALPGVPREMRGMMSDELVPLLRAQQGGAPATVVRSRTLRTTGIAESALAELMGGLSRDVLACDLAFLPGVEGVDLRLTVRDQPAPAADSLLERAASLVRAAVSRHVYGEGETDLASVVLDVYRARGWRIALAESCTGGLLGERLTDPAGASDVVEGGVVAYDNRVKTALLGVSEATLASQGAVNDAVARQMASGARTRLGTAVGIGITGIAGPGGGSDAKPVGTVWIGLDVEGVVTSRPFHFTGDRTEVRERAAQAALLMLLRALR